MVNPNTWILMGLGFAIFCSISCNPNHSYIKKQFEISQGQWDVSNILEDSFQFDKDLDSVGFQISTLHDEDFNYQNLYLKVKVTTPYDILLDTIHSLELMDQGTYQWRGQSKANSHIYYSQTLPQVFKLVKGQPYTISIAQYSRDSILSGIHQIGFEVISLIASKKKE